MSNLEDKDCSDNTGSRQENEIAHSFRPLKILKNRNPELTWEEFTAGYGINVKTMQSYNNSKRTLQPDVALRLAEEYNVTLDWLYGRTKQMNNSDAMANILMALYKVIKVELKKDRIRSKDGDEYIRDEMVFYVDARFHAYLKDIKQLIYLRSSSDSITDEAFFLMRKEVQEKHRDLLTEIFDEENIAINENADIKIDNFDVANFDPLMFV